ncbi:internal virion protein [Ralstonia phage P-PSG-11-1]|uniref:Internal virion protein n=1 Tax=Ralstonia phage P-PSG-11 TaxID=2652430 RepID=A0A5P8D3X8_9CAUD|nr:internal virion protein [Ralstonia phage P-PSG-11]QFP93731.1 internal virion protein [Ralstonia phage P-PSG-11-1]
MCGPAAIPIAMLVITGASTAASISAQQQQQKAQDSFNQREYENKMTAYRGNLANIEVQRNQAQDDAAAQKQQNDMAAQRATATATTAAGEAGVSGTSVDALLRDLAGQAAYDNTNVDENYLRQDRALNAQRENAFNGTVSQINQLRPSMSPDYLGAGLRIGQAAVGAYGQYQQNLYHERNPSVPRRGV